MKCPNYGFFGLESHEYDINNRLIEIYSLYV